MVVLIVVVITLAVPVVFWPGPPARWIRVLSDLRPLDAIGIVPLALLAAVLAPFPDALSVVVVATLTGLEPFSLAMTQTLSAPGPFELLFYAPRPVPSQSLVPALDPRSVDLSDW